MAPFQVYCEYLALKLHFMNPKYDYFKYNKKVRASESAFKKRKDRYFFEKTSRKYQDKEIVDFLVSNFISTSNANGIWIGEIIENGEQIYTNWLKKSQSLFYLFKTEAEVFIHKDSFVELFEIKNNQHPEILKKYFQKVISLETMVILDMILGYVKKFDKKLTDPVWETVSLRIQKYKPFINIDVAKYKEVLKEIVL